MEQEKTIQDLRFEYPEHLYANFDHSFDATAITALEMFPDKYWGYHAASNFMGCVWPEDGRWYEEIWVHKGLVEVLQADTMKEVIEKANETYGRK